MNPASSLPSLAIEEVPIDRLRPDPANPHRISEDELHGVEPNRGFGGASEDGAYRRPSGLGYRSAQATVKAARTSRITMTKPPSRIAGVGIGDALVTRGAVSPVALRGPGGRRLVHAPTLPTVRCQSPLAWRRSPAASLLNAPSRWREPARERLRHTGMAR